MAIPTGTGPFQGFTTGQLIGEVLQDQKNQNSKARRRQKIALAVTGLLGLGDATLKAKHDKVIKKLDESKVPQIAKSAKMYDDATQLQTVQESIDNYGGGLNGAFVHFDANAEAAFDSLHQNQLQYYDSPNATATALDVKRKWKQNFIKNNLYKKHTERYNAADAGKVSQVSKEEFLAPVNDYFNAQLNLANDPANKSIIHKGIRKGAEILGLRNEGDALHDKVMEEQLDFQKQNKEIDNYRNIYNQSQKLIVPEAITRGQVEGLKMTETEFYQSWKADPTLNQNYAKLAYETFVKEGGTLLAYQTAVASYFGDKISNDTSILQQQALAKLSNVPEYKKLQERITNAKDNGRVDQEALDSKELLESIAIAEVFGGDASSMRLHMESRRATSALISSGKYVLKEDDPNTPDVNEMEEHRDQLYADTWAKIQAENIRKLTGDIDLNKVRQQYVTNESAVLFGKIYTEDQAVMNSIRNYSLPVEGESSIQFGRQYLTNLIAKKYNTETANEILEAYKDTEFNYNEMQNKNLLGKDELFAAQKRWFLYDQHGEMNKHAYLATQYLENLQKLENFNQSIQP